VKYFTPGLGKLKIFNKLMNFQVFASHLLFRQNEGYVPDVNSIFDGGADGDYLDSLGISCCNKGGFGL